MDFDKITAYGEPNEKQEVFGAILEHYTTDFDEALEVIEDAYIYEGSMGDYVRENTNLDDVPEYFQNYIDFDAIGYDMETGGYICELSYNSYLIINI